MLSPRFTMNYTLTSNDDIAIEFSADQLEFCNYARNIFTDTDGSWMLSVDDTLPVYPMNQVELRALHTFLRIRVEEGAPRIRVPSPIMTNCPVRMNRAPVQICRFIYLPALISINNIQSWSHYYTGLRHSYHNILDTIIPGLVHTVDETEASVMRRWIGFARFLGCADLQYLLEARFLWHVSEALERHAGAQTSRYTFDPDYLEKLVEIVSSIIYMDDQNYDMVFMKRLKGYILEFWRMREEEPEYTAYIVRKYLHHRGPDMPCPDWTTEQWAVYCATMERIYEEAYQAPDTVREYDRHPFNEFRSHPVQEAPEHHRQPLVVGDWH